MLSASNERGGGGGREMLSAFARFNERGGGGGGVRFITSMQLVIKFIT